MVPEKFELALQDFAEKTLCSTSYGSDCSNYQETQLNQVILKIDELFAEDTAVIHRFDQALLVPPITRINKTQMANIGVSATRCLQRLKAYKYENKLSNSLYNIVDAYLRQVAVQAQSAYKKQAEKLAEEQEPETLEQRVVRLLTEYANDFDSIQKSLISDVENAKSISAAAQKSAADVQRLSDDVNKAVVEARNYAELAKKTADNAKETATTAEKLATTVRNSINTANETVEKAKSDLEKAEKELEKAEKTADNIMPNMLTVLSIFVGAVIAVVACYLSFLLSSRETNEISRTSIPLGFMSLWMMGHIIIMIVFLFLYMTSKLTNRSLACRCSCFAGKKLDSSDESPISPKPMVEAYHIPECAECQKCCGPLIRLKFCYPYFFWLNITFISGYVLIGIAHIVDLYYADFLNKLIQSNWLSLSIFGVIVIAALITITMLAVIRIRKTSPSK